MRYNELAFLYRGGIPIVIINIHGKIKKMLLAT